METVTLSKEAMETLYNFCNGRLCIECPFSADSPDSDRLMCKIDNPGEWYTIPF